MYFGHWYMVGMISDEESEKLEARAQGIRGLAIQGLNREQIMDRGFTRWAVYSTLQGWKMNQRVIKLRKRAWETMGPGA